jgi:protein TonB
MKPELAVGFLAAVILHALVLFALKLETPAHPLALSEDPSQVDVSLVAAPPESPPATAAATPSEPAPAPEPVQAPEPIPTPAPQPTPDMPTPPPRPSPEEDAIPAPGSTPAPEHPKRAPHRQQHSKPTAPHAAAGAAAALAGAASRGAATSHPDSHARYLSNPKPDYPAAARRRHQEGVVLVSVEVGTDGRPSDVALGRSSGFPLLDQAAVQAVRRWIFAPAQEAGFPVASRVDVPVRFSLSR